MRTLAGKMALVVVAVAAFGVLFVGVVAPLLDRDRAHVLARATLQNGLGWAVQGLNNTPPAQRPELLASMRHDFGFDLVLLGEDAVRALLDGDLPREAVVLGPPQSTRLYVPLIGGGYLVAGPLEVNPVGPTRLVAPAILLAIVALLSAWVIAAPLTRRLRRLQQATHALAQGDLKARVEVSSGDVVGELSADFNTMADRLARLFAERDQLMQAVSHEISTPLARMRFHLEALQDARDDNVRARRVAALDVELLEIDQLSAELASWVDAGGRRDQREPTDVASMLRAIAEYQGAPAAMKRPVTLALDVPPGELVVPADARQLHRAVDNVVRNAVRYAGTRVVLEARAVTGAVEIRIIDDGPGIPAADRVRIFEPFTRLDPSRARTGGTGGGVGLGLAITHRIVTRHQGTVTAQDAPGGGACLCIRLPAA
jgi:signal transduction histidine kinase